MLVTVSEQGTNKPLGTTKSFIKSQNSMTCNVSVIVWIPGLGSTWNWSWSWVQLQLQSWSCNSGVGIGVETSGVGVGVDIQETCRSWSWSWNSRSWSWNWSWNSRELELELELKFCQVNFYYSWIIWNIWLKTGSIISYLIHVITRLSYRHYTLSDVLKYEDYDFFDFV